MCWVLNSSPPKDGLEEMEDEATLISSTVDINHTTSVLTKQLVTSKDDIIKYFPEILGLGKFPGKLYHINTDPNVPPKHFPAQTSTCSPTSCI